MDLTKHPDALMTGFQAPQFPSCLEVLIKVIELFFIQKLYEIAPLVAGFQKIELHEATSDVYSWCMTLYFEVNDGQICLAIPFGQDADKTNNANLDRFPAIYPSSSNIDESQIYTVIAQLSRAILDCVLTSHQPKK